MSKQLNETGVKKIVHEKMIPMIKKEAQKRNPTTVKKKNNGLGEFTKKFKPEESDESFNIDD